jgi:hypothetical protein
MQGPSHLRECSGVERQLALGRIVVDQQLAAGGEVGSEGDERLPRPAAITASRTPSSTLDKDLDLAAAGETDLPGLVVGDAEIQ